MPFQPPPEALSYRDAVVVPFFLKLSISLRRVPRLSRVTRCDVRSL